MPVSPRPLNTRRSSSLRSGGNHGGGAPLHSRGSFLMPTFIESRIPNVTYSMVSASFMLGFVSMLVLSEVEQASRIHHPGPCSSELEVRNMLAGMQQGQYFDRFMAGGYDRLDIISDSHYLDMKEAVDGLRPYHWARIKAEALRLTTHKRVSAESLLKDEDLGMQIVPDAPEVANLAASNLEQDPGEMFIGIKAGQYIPDAAVGDPVVTTLLTGPLSDRLGTLVNAVQLAQAVGGALHIIWVLDRECGARFSSLFSLRTDKVSVSCLPLELPLSNVFPAQQTLDAFDAVFASKDGAIAHLLHDVEKTSNHPFTERWLAKEGAAESIAVDGDVTHWARERVGSEMRVHILHKVDELAAGVAIDIVNDAMKKLGIALAPGIHDKVRRTVNSNAIERRTTVAVYESEVRMVELPRQKTILLLPSPRPEGASAPALPEGVDNVIRSTYNASAQHAIESTIVDLLSTAALVAHVPIEILTAENAPTATEYRPVSRIASVLCPIGLLCPDP